MSSLAQSLSILMLIFAVPIAGLAGYAFQHRENLGVRGFLLCLVGMSGWSVLIAIVTWPTQLLPVHVEATFRFGFHMLVFFGWPLLVWEYRTRTRLTLSRPVLAALFLIPAVTLVLAATNPSHHLVIAAETPANPAGLGELVFGPWYLVHMGLAVTLVIIPAGMLLSDLRTAHGTHRKQLLFLLAGWVVGVTGALHFFVLQHIETIPLYVNLTPLMFIVTAGLWGTALFRYQLFSMLPVSRRVAIETMPDPVLSVDSNGVVVDANPAAKTLFETSRMVGEQTLAEFCRPYPEIYSLHEMGTDQTAEVSLDTPGGSRQFSVYIRPIRQGGSVTGSLIVLREITKLREREQELELLKQVLSRVFRHNMRNRLNVMDGHLTEITDELDDSEFETHTATIAETIDQLLSHSDKAVEMQAIIDTDANSTVALDAVVRHEVTSLQEAQPALDIAADYEALSVRCHPDIEKAIQELLENAIAHACNDHETFQLRLTVCRRNEMGCLIIEDNGPGIPLHEIEALNAGEETDLKHGSGVGLWLVRLLVEKSGGTLSIDTDTDLGGTRVELAVPVATSDAADPQPPG